MQKIKKGIVFIVDRVENRKNINLYSNNLEMTSPVFYAALEKAASEISDRVHFYNLPSSFIDNISRHKDDIIFPCIWSGTDSKNRKILLPSVCEAYNLCYIGADAFVHALCADKSLSKKYCEQFGLKTSKEVIFRKNDSFLEIIKTLDFPLVIKPNYEGSSIGISDNNLVDNYDGAVKLIQKLQKKYSEIIVEEYIEGHEVAICIAGNEIDIFLFEAVKLILNGEDYFTNSIWGFESKKGGIARQEREIITASIPEEIKQIFLKIFISLGKVDYMRIDCRIRNSEFYLIELTPDCSLHPNCFMAKAFFENGYNYSAMINALIHHLIK